MDEPTAPAAHILVVDDDPRIRDMLVRYFEGEGYQVKAVADGTAMRECLRTKSFDIIFLDLVLPGKDDGLALARHVRSESDIPIIMLTGRDDVVDRIVGLEVGADDYIAKPFHLREVLARLKAVLKRRHSSPREIAAPTGEIIRFDGCMLDADRRQLTAADGSEIILTTAEFDMLAVLAKQPGRVFTRDMLMELTRAKNWDVYDRTIDAQIARLRKKIERDRSRPALIKSVRGVGYVFTGKMER